jgi:hypothetical protein
MIPLPKGQLGKSLKIFPTNFRFSEIFTENNLIFSEPVEGLRGQ